MSSTSTTSKQSGGIMSIGEMIDTTFGDKETNTVNHKLMQTVLFLLARQLRILDRKVSIELPGGYRLASNTSALSITEVKIHSMAKKKKKQPKTADDAEKSKGGISVGGGFGAGTITVAFGATSAGGFRGGAPSDDASMSKKTTTSSKKPRPTEKRSVASTKSSSGASTKKTASSTSTSRGLSAYAKILDDVEQQREEELRVIRQRVDSREDQEKTPSPMASLDSVEATYEKLLIVERVPSDQAKVRGKGQPQLSVVTQEQFNELRKKVEKLQEKFGPIGLASFPENVKLMQELRRGASLTDAMAALQLSARLEATEKTMEQMIALVTALASKTPGVEEGIEELLSADTKASIKKDAPIKKDAIIKKGKTTDGAQEVGAIKLIKPATSAGNDDSSSSETADNQDGSLTAKDFITYQELEEALQGLSSEMLKMVQQLLQKANTNAEGAIKLATLLERKLEPSLNMGTRMDNLEAMVAEYSIQINTFDTNLTAQMTNYQEELTQMQHDLEMALETMADIMANSGGDATAVAEMNSHFNNLQTDIEDTLMRQKDLQNLQTALAVDLESLRKEIEILRDVKSDRDEVADALRDKAGIAELNGMVSVDQFNAIRADFEKRVLGAYDKFNSQETLWQKAIDELIRELNEKADIVQVESLKEDINDHMEKLRKRLNSMLEIVGEPKAAALTRQIHRDAACLSCATPAIMEIDENKIPVLPKAKAPGGSEHIRKEGGDYKPCYPGLPIPHPIDPRAQFCKRWCGGSHTTANLPRLPPDTVLTQPLGRHSTLGNYGKANTSDGNKTAAEISAPKPSEQGDARPEMSPKDFASTEGKEDATPPARSDMTPSDYASTRGIEEVTPPIRSDMALPDGESTQMTQENVDETPPALPDMPLPDLESTHENVDVTPPLPRDED